MQNNKLNSNWIKDFNRIRFQIIQNNTIYALYSLRNILDDYKELKFKDELRIFVNNESHKKIDFLDNEKFAKNFNKFIIENDLLPYIRLIDLKTLNNTVNIKGEHMKLTDDFFKKIDDKRIYSHSPTYVIPEWIKDYINSGFPITFSKIGNKFILNENSINLYFFWLMSNYENNLNYLNINKKLFENDRTYSIYNFKLNDENKNELIKLLEDKNIISYKKDDIKNTYQSINTSRMPMDLIDFFILATKCATNKKIKKEDIKNIYLIKKIMSIKENKDLNELLTWSIGKIFNFENNKTYDSFKEIILFDKKIDKLDLKLNNFFNIIKFVLWIYNKTSIENLFPISTEYFISKENAKIIIQFIIENSNWNKYVNNFVSSLIKADILNETFDRYTYHHEIDKSFSKDDLNINFNKINKIKLWDARINGEIFKYPIIFNFNSLKIEKCLLLNILVLNKILSLNEIKEIKQSKLELTLDVEYYDENHFNFKNYSIRKVVKNNNSYVSKNTYFHDEEINIKELDEAPIKIFGFEKFKLKKSFIKEIDSTLETDEKFVNFQSIKRMIDLYLRIENNAIKDQNSMGIDFSLTWEWVFNNRNKIFDAIYNEIDFPSKSYNFEEVVKKNIHVFKKNINLIEHVKFKWH